MAFKLSAAALEKAIQHLCKYGDTDVFPHLPELAFFRDESAVQPGEGGDSLDLEDCCGFCEVG